MSCTRRWVLLALAACLLGCAPTFAPVPRVGTAGSPMPLEAGRMGVIVSVTMPSAAPALDGGVSVQVTNWLAAEVGANWASREWALAWTGLRFQVANSGSRDARIVLEFDAGGAAGVGGERCDNGQGANGGCPPDGQPDGRDWVDRAAGGGYLGVGLALHFSWFSVFFRDRVAGAGAEGVPPTVWNLLSLGIQAAPLDLFRLWVAYLWGVYANDLDQNQGFALEAGIGFTFDVWDPSG
ncbi:MAG: hypothetical protein HY905_02475 [Deltaproteobacteria bacterium]|nr:hypothetical protein [Deltaproteobacteria bacterium]